MAGVNEKENLNTVRGDLEKLYDEALSLTSTSASPQTISSSQSLKEIKDVLLNATQKSSDSGFLYTKLTTEPERFLQLAKNLDDTTILLTIVESKKPIITTPDIQKILSALRIKIKDGEKEESLANCKFYLQLYASLITQTKIVNTQHIGLFLTLVGKIAKVDHLVLIIVVQCLQIEKANTIEAIKDYLEVQIGDEADDVGRTSGDSDSGSGSGGGNIKNNDDDENIPYIDGASFKNFLAVVEMCFPVIPEETTQIYTRKRTKEYFLEKKHEKTFYIPILKCMSASCIVENCRKFNADNYKNLMENSFQSYDKPVKVLASLVLAKEWSFIHQSLNNKKIKITDVADCLMLYIEGESENDKDHENYIDFAVEGLTYVSLFWEAREWMRVDVSFVEKLLDIFQRSSKSTNINTSIQYVVLTILANLTRSKSRTSSQYQGSRSELKQAVMPKVGSDSNEEKIDGIRLFNEELLKDDELISKLSSVKTYESSSKNIMNAVVDIIYNISSDQKKSVRTELVKQGALTIIVNYLIKNSKIEKVEKRLLPTIPNDAQQAEIYLKALQSLARMMISVNPEIAFKNYDVKTTIPFLTQLLGNNENINDNDSNNDNDNNDNDNNDNNNNNNNLELTLLDKYESLLALTNVASIENPSLRDFIITEFFPYVDDLILSSHLQLATFQLLSNLINRPVLLAKFFNVEQTKNKERLSITLKLFNSVEVNLQVAVGKFLVNATEFDMIAEVLVSTVTIRNELLEILVSILDRQLGHSGDENKSNISSHNNNSASGDQEQKELIIVASYLLVNLVYAAANKDLSILAAIRDYKGLKGACKEILTRGSPEAKEAMHSVVEVLEFK
ncbi:SWI5-dependent HO expression protein 4 [Lodderomyces elongisporus]|uniref:SWI5-dependent HO expression protein 4 n=1 Tax=Lodderomyces elongisporus TaxID=36914 RepID=UPI00292407ED|nr:SWI5-dependent HO expression protein 4 [Lodderomyces elongisporus]WLF77540.1 SWI5-dependent HO expression protein 4 [Lodderomyces elongisporus]